MLQKRLLAAGAIGGILASAVVAARFAGQTAPTGWPTHAGDPKHNAMSTTGSQALDRILWSKPIDLAPQYSGEDLLAHYGSPICTPNNTVIYPVKTGATDGFRVMAVNGDTGARIWQFNSTYTVPPHGWFPMYSPTLFGTNGVAWPQAGGLVARRTDPDLATGTRSQVCFYGAANYAADKATYDANIKIVSPLVGDAAGNIYFTYRAYGDTPLHLKGGIVKIKPDGKAIYVEAPVAAGDADFTRPKMNSAPAVAKNVLYVVLKRSGSSEGMLVGLSPDTLKTRFKTKMLDPKTGNPAWIDDDGTASPVVGPDGDVFVGVLESPFGHNHYRGWLLHFNGNLTITKTPGAFGWDDTPSVVPTRLIPGYEGVSTYVLLCKYNNYVQGGGDGANKIALVDPTIGSLESISGVHTMTPIMTVTGPTPDQNFVADFPNAVREWCVNTAAIDTVNGCAILNNEDGILYKWDFATNSIAENIRLTDGIGEAYTSTIIGAHGQVFGMSNAKLYAIGANP